MMEGGSDSEREGGRESEREGGREGGRGECKHISVHK